MLTAADIRRMYVDFFLERGHTHVASAPLVPPDDPTLLFTSAGMVQFKALYSGTVALPYSRAVTVQKCLRAGGKGSDLENVGKTLRHFTFFEMLGNFSFGDYFKNEAIEWGWEFCTSAKWLGLPAERIWATIYGKRGADGKWIYDDEAERAWREQTGLKNPITRLDEKENYWGPAGETGACGPCSEIKFFTGTAEQLAEYQELGRRGTDEAAAKIAHDIVEAGDLFLEIWNLVFPQFDQQMDGSRPPLKNRGIDTGMGLERTTTAAQLMGSGGRIRTPYETDLLRPLVEAVAGLAGLPYPALGDEGGAAEKLRSKGLEADAVRLAINACMDHARALTFTLGEGIVPSNEGRGYVLRRILRRAARFGKKIGVSEPFLWKMVEPIVQTMGDVYPELKKHPEMVRKIIRSEEERFNRTLNQGSEILEELLAGKAAGEKLSGDEAHRLYDTYGFPLDLTIEAAEERGVGVDVEGFNRALAEGKSRARSAWKAGAGVAKCHELLRGIEGGKEFTGYQSTRETAEVLVLIHGDARVERLEEGQNGIVVLDRSPFYAEAGGQIGDTGAMLGEEGVSVFKVEDTQKNDAGVIIHYGVAEAPVMVGQKVVAAVDEERRRDTMANHSSVHLMQAALKQLVGEHVTQQGSFVGPEGMRFDFTNPEPLDEATQRAVEEAVNESVRAALPVVTKEMTLEEARQTGAIAPFGEKYGARVRVVSMGEGEAAVSREFCGGTHVANTGRLGLFVITGESSVASGIRRIEGKAGRAALNHVTAERRILRDLSRTLSAPAENLEARLAAMQEEAKTLRRALDEARAERARAKMAEAAAEAREVAGLKLVTQRLDGADHNALIQAWDALRQKSREKTVGIFCSVAEGKVNLVVGATEDVAPSRISAAEILRELASSVGGKGGGKPTLARGGGTQGEHVEAALAGAAGVVQRLATQAQAKQH